MAPEDERNETVRFLNHETGRVDDIPLSALPSGAALVRNQGEDEDFWVLPEHLRPGDVKHGAFSDGVRELIREIRSAFLEHYPRSIEQWEDGFRRDTHPEREIALWLHAAQTYQGFAAVEEDARRRREIYACIIVCMTTSLDTVWLQCRPRLLSRLEAERIVNAFYCQQG